jgi:hypothetical protein
VPDVPGQEGHPPDQGTFLAQPWPLLGKLPRSSLATDNSQPFPVYRWLMLMTLRSTAKGQQRLRRQSRQKRKIRLLQTIDNNNHHR